MPTQATWRDMSWEVTPDKVRGIGSLSTSCKLKKVKDGDGETRPRGKDLQPVSITYQVGLPVGVDPRAEYDKWEARVGRTGSLKLGGRRFGPASLQLQQAGIEPLEIAPNGTILVADISLAFKELAPAESEADGLQILYQGRDIYPEISLQSCVHDMYAASRSDELELTFNDTGRLWDGWSPEHQDTIEVVYGTARTGKMFVESVQPENGAMTLRAWSIPPAAKNRRSKSWEKAKLLQFADEIAQRHGLVLEVHGVADQLYPYAAQEDAGDFGFLEYRCMLEGVAFLVFDGKLVLYAEAELEAQTLAKTLTIGPESDYEYTDDAMSAYGSVEVSNGTIVGTFATTGGSEKVLRETLTLPLETEAEAGRFARGLLRRANRDAVSGVYTTALQRDLAAGSVVTIQTEGAGSWDGPAFLYHVRHDYVREKSKLFFRRPLEGY